MAKLVLVIDNRPQAQIDVQTQGQVVQQGLENLNQLITDLAPANFAGLSAAAKTELLRSGLLLVARGLRWLVNLHLDN